MQVNHQNHGKVTNYRWYKQNKDFFIREQREVKKTFPHLRFCEKEGTIYLCGNIDIIDNNGIKHGNFKIRIIFPDDYPKSFPIFTELSEKIPRIPERHVNGDGSLCLCVRPLQQVYIKRGLRITQIIKELLIPFLANQIVYDKKGKWAIEEYSHYDDGIIEYYKELFHTKNLKIIIKAFEKAINGIKYSKNELCFCGSGKKIKKCHLESYNFLRSNFDKEYLKNDLKILKNVIKN